MKRLCFHYFLKPADIRSGIPRDSSFLDAPPAHVSTAPLVPASTAASRLLTAFERAASRRSSRVLRVEVPLDPVDPLLWLSAQTGVPATYWRGRGDTDARAGIGAALVLEAASLADPVLEGALDTLPPGARMIATARFDADAEMGSEWSTFGATRLVLPRVELCSDGRSATLAVHLAPGESPDEARRVIARLHPVRDLEAASLPLPYMRRDDPDRAEWGRMIRWSLASFDAGSLDKVVLARCARFSFEDNLDAVALLRRLEAATPRCYHALIAPSGLGGPVFLTATPERLMRLDGRTLQTEAVAGTRPRAEADAADDKLRDELLESEKDRREHGFVRAAIQTVLEGVSSSVEVDEQASAMAQARVQHLRTRIRAVLEDGVGPVEVARALHPTPAVGGTPTDCALDSIRRLEPFDRGLYAGPIGWIGRDLEGEPAADLAVGIRSGLVDGKTLALYSGAGIVSGSDPAGEWAEIEHKIGDFARVLGLSDRVEA